MESITSTRNPRVRELAELARPRVRRDRGQHLVEGPNAVAEALAAGVVEEVFVTEDGRRFLGTVALPEGVQTTLVTDHVLRRLADAATPQGILALARSTTATLGAVSGRGLLVVLHQIADPGNLGTVLRTADAAGAAGVVVTVGSVDPFSAKAVRAAAGSTYHLPLVVGAEIEQVVATCRAAGQRILGLAADGVTSVFSLQTATQPVALVLGNEAHGLPDAAMALLDDTVAIPRYGAAESLNLAAAAAIAIFAAAQGLAGVDDPACGRAGGAR
jgi:RNA methyltransferase, TrmH family